MKTRRCYLIFHSMTRIIIVSITCFLQGAFAQDCANVSGTWHVEESATVIFSAEGETETVEASGSGEITIEQNGCQISFYSPGLDGDIMLLREGTVTNNSITFSGRMVPDMPDVSCSGNLITGNGDIEGNTIYITTTGSASCSVEGTSVSITSNGSAVFTRTGGTATAWFTFSPEQPLAGQAINFDASLSSPCNPDGTIIMYEWDFGDGDITTNLPFYTHTYETPGVYTVTLRILDDDGCEDSVSMDLTVVQVSVDSVGFTGDHMITDWPSGRDIDNPDGSNSVWTNGIIDSDPVCYTKNISPTMFATFTVEPSVPDPGVSGVSIRAKVNDIIIGSASGCSFRATAIEDSLNTDGDVDRIGGGSAIPDSDGVKMLNPAFTWEVSCDGIIWYPIGISGPHTMYFIDSGPSASPLYDLGLEKACGYVDGDTDIAGKINTELADKLYYAPQDGCTNHDLHIFDTGINRGQCCCHAAVFSLLVSHVTNSNPSLVYLWGGCSSSLSCHYNNPPNRLGPTFQCDCPTNDDAPYQPHFTFHVEVDCGTIYDPSYGTTDLTKFLETACPHPDAAKRQTGPSRPSSYHRVSSGHCPCPD